VPEHSAAVFGGFYGIAGLGPAAVYVVGAVELSIIVAFLLGIAKRFSYGAVFILHAISTLASFRMYLGFDNLLFFAAWPMLAACFALYLLRDLDTLGVVGGRSKVIATAQ
jgi:hypothetical protein